jgi:hypothetical protein
MHDGEVLRSVVVLMSGIERVVTSGTFELDGGSWDVDNNIWLVGDDKEVIVIDAAHDARPSRTPSPTARRRGGVHPRPQRPHHRRTAAVRTWTRRCS